eukprot:CAMPEP_0184859820 /NCGR_PEP_ID=MMETSP0580-20130426/4803_1 /TAXON_ID=1118495 /ORGANISM="Dactyliosolen fragilissimus" /LENGTH=445 /DNA_ID=CAMNT_0027356663 /DNA_START=60 /DNA_END=1400 /DNA_ORIENTATION=+
MKIFAKRKSSSSASATSSASKATKNDNAVTDTSISYFSENFNKKSSSIGETKGNKQQESIDAETQLKELLTMDYSTLNAKQRRIIRRHHQRQSALDDKNKSEMDSEIVQDVKENESSTQGKETDANITNVISKHKFDTNIRIDIKHVEPNASTKNVDKNIQANEQNNNNNNTKQQQCQQVSDDDDNDKDLSNTTKPATKTNISVNIEEGSKKNSDSITPKLAHDSDNKESIPSTDTNNALSIQKQMEGMNSKERRKFLRKLQADAKDETATPSALSTSQLLAAAEQQAKLISERNRIMEEDKQKEIVSLKEKKRNHDSNTNKGTPNQLSSSSPVTTTPSSSSSPPCKKSKKVKDLTHLPPEELQRREKQRQMQKEAAERRASGHTSNAYKHPLNSERRRANRRKPGGKLAKIITIKKERKENTKELRQYNAGGYNVRKQKRSFAS